MSYQPQSAKSVSTLFQEGQTILNVGLVSFAESIVQAGGKAIQVDWTPPAGGDRAAGWALAELVQHPRVESANQTAYSNYLAAQPMLVGIGVARAEVPGLARAHDPACGPAHSLE